MRHQLKISVSRDPVEMHLVRCRRIPVRERFLRWLFGEKRRVTVIVPGDTVDTISVVELPEGGSLDECANHAG
jgi:hypothetical protein